MSFSGDVKAELSGVISDARHCRIAEIAAFINLCANIERSGREEYSLILHTENVTVARKCFTLLKKTFNINTEISIRQNQSLKKNRSYRVIICGKENCDRVLHAVRLTERIPENDYQDSVHNMIVQKECCKRAYIRGAYLASGSISSPEKFYHFEISCMEQKQAHMIKELLNSFEGIDAKVINRKKYYVVYIKEGAQIVDILNIMGAHISLMKMENVRILKDVRNSVNRKVNCEMANINKTVTAAMRQIEDIEYLEKTMGLDNLPEALAEVAEIRLEHPEATLQELGMLLNPRVGKSGVNHRLRKLSGLAKELRSNKEEKL